MKKSNLSVDVDDDWDLIPAEEVSVYDLESEESDDSSLSLAFNPDLHPRDPNGRFSSGAGISNIKDLKFKKSLGGSTGAKLYEGDKGKQYVLKKGASLGQAKAEFTANNIYRAAKIAAPASSMIDNTLVTRYVADAKSLDQLEGSERAAAEEKLREGFAVDALLGNWDVVGLQEDNILVTADGEVIRVDNGGSMTYRAMGKEKAFPGELPKELTSLRDPDVNSHTGPIFEKLTDEDVAAQINKLDREAILDAAGEHRDVIEKRLDAMEKWANEVSPADADDGESPTNAGESPTLDGIETKVPMTKTQLAKIKAINPDLSSDTLNVPLAMNANQVAILQKQFPDKKIVKVNALKMMKGKEGPVAKAASTPAPAVKSSFDVPKQGKDFPKSKFTQKYADAIEEWGAVEEEGEEAELVSDWIGDSTHIRHQEKINPNGDTAQTWNALLDRAPTYEGVVYRGLSKTKLFKDLPEVGALVEMPTSSSASRNPETARSFGQNRFLRIKTKTAVGLPEHSWTSEQEVILRKDSKYRVTGVHKAVPWVAASSDSQKGDIIDLEEV